MARSNQPNLFDLRITPRISRRDLLIGMAAAGGIAALTTLGYRAIGTEEGHPSEEKVPFFGIHQAGVVNPAPAAAILVAFDTTAQDKSDLIKLFQTLTDRIQFLMAGGTPPARDPKFPPLDSGLMGPNVSPDNLTVTMSVGASLFDDRFGLAALKPKHLTQMTSFPNDQLDPAQCHGDIFLQICANTSETTLHALRDIVKNTASSLTMRWKMEGFLPPTTHKRLGKDTSRNMLGFKDGTANLDVQDDDLMNEVVWTGRDRSEPAWTAGGTYEAVRIIRNRVEFWDRTPLQEQEALIGRHKNTGAPLGLQNEHDTPDYARDPQGKQIPLEAHIRLANPRTPATHENLILRRGFNYSRGVDSAGHLDMGLLFISFQADLEKGFITVQNRLNGEALEEYITPIGGGYFFVLPGVESKDHYLGQSLLTAV